MQHVVCYRLQAICCMYGSCFETPKFVLQQPGKIFYQNSEYEVNQVGPNISFNLAFKGRVGVTQIQLSTARGRRIFCFRSNHIYNVNKAIKHENPQYLLFHFSLHETTTFPYFIYYRQVKLNEL
jgi:hypothetical protein